MITVLSPDRVVIGGGVAAAGDLLFDPIRAEIARRVTTTPVEAVTLVAAELGPWAGAVGAAVHGAERAAEAVDAPGAGPVAGRLAVRATDASSPVVGPTR